MATTCHDPKAGDAVYRFGKPVQVGKIVSVGKGGRVLVRWLKDGSVTNEASMYLQSFDALVADTERKATNHRATLVRVQAL